MTNELSQDAIGLKTADPEACQSLEDVRLAIDTIDQRIIELLGKRLGYVLTAARFKPSEAAIPAPDRVAKMLPERAGWSEKAGLPADFIVPLFAQIIQWFIQRQIRHWQDQEPS